MRQTRLAQVTPGGLANLCIEGVAPAYDVARAGPQLQVVTTETGWRVGAAGHWSAVTPTPRPFVICAGRGFEDHTDSRFVRDGWVSGHQRGVSEGPTL